MAKREREPVSEAQQWTLPDEASVEAAPVLAEAGGSEISRPRRALPIALIDFDPRNRKIEESSESFVELLDSVRTFGVIHPPQVRECGGRYKLHDGERRLRAALKAGLTEVVCDIWPATAGADVLLASVALQQHHEPHRVVHVARRLRIIKNEEGLTLEQLAGRTGIQLARVKTYQSLLQASDDLLAFFDESDVPLSVAAAMVRYEGDTSEAKSRHLIAQYRRRPLTRDEVTELRHRERRSAKKKEEGEEAAELGPRPPLVLARRFAAALQKNPATEIPKLDALLQQLGYQIVPKETETAAVYGETNA